MRLGKSALADGASSSALATSSPGLIQQLAAAATWQPSTAAQTPSRRRPAGRGHCLTPRVRVRPVLLEHEQPATGGQARSAQGLNLPPPDCGKARRVAVRCGCRDESRPSRCGRAPTCKQTFSRCGSSTISSSSPSRSPTAGVMAPPSRREPGGEAARLWLSASPGMDEPRAIAPSLAPSIAIDVSDDGT